MNENTFTTAPLVVFSVPAQVLATSLFLAPSGVAQRRGAGTHGWMS